MTRDENGNIRADIRRFPNGIKNLTNWLHERGFNFGLYTSAGDKVCAIGAKPHKPPGSYGHYTQDAQTFAGWNVDYVKIGLLFATFSLSFSLSRGEHATQIIDRLVWKGPIQFYKATYRI